MRGNVIFAAVFLAGVAGFAAANSCNADNCLRAMRATQHPGQLDHAKSFCTTYMSPASTVVSAAIPSYAVDDCKDNQNGPLSLRVSSACSCIMEATTTGRKGTPTITQSVTKSLHPCAEVGASWSQQRETATVLPTVAASLAYECLKSVPIVKENAIKLVDGIKPILEWQSDTAYKKDPPKGYFYPGYDMFGNLAEVRSNLESDKYSGEYEFQADLFNKLTAPSCDGHFSLVADLLTVVLWTRQPLAIVSISEDGDSLPVIKLQIVANPKSAQVIAKINGIEASKYVEDTANLAPDFQDVDAAYNSMFWSKATYRSYKSLGNFVGGGRGAFIHHGTTTNITFANGTTIELENKAAIFGNMTGVVDGPSMYEKFCVPQKSTNNALLRSSNLPKAIEENIFPARNRHGIEAFSTTTNVTIPGYPDPVIATKDGIVSGYYLKGHGYETIAVLSVRSFKFNDKVSSSADFQAVISDFLREARTAGKTKLIIDFQNNPGGYILLGYDLFRQLFPSIIQDGYSRWKLNNGFLAISRLVSEHAEDEDLASRPNPAKPDPDYKTLPATWFNYRSDLNLTNQKFSTFNDKFDPHLYQDTDYSALMRWNLSDPRITTNKTTGIGIQISGYGSRSNLTQYFEAEDIVLLHDGLCSSTCAVASGALRLQGGVKSIAMGGRPRPGHMQAIGGIKGAQSINLYDIHNFAYLTSVLTNDTNIQKELARYRDLNLLNRLVVHGFFGLNGRDQILHNNVNDGIPAQYVYEAADCRLYWTAPMISDINEVWKAAANSAFNNVKCAAGSISRSKHRRTNPVPVPRSTPSKRLSDSVDNTPVTHDRLWEAVHNQEANVFQLAMG
ncbi:hypothetical protein QQS21_006770 [Conoideocrella luteorostrata]|uniref:CPAF-like PDZ domain-containing protein n=1 Tax=Conoideocrella luteorostrata TaxID=1105319 RepID=A0AAJ0CMB7_9HYPO|nr:hypothetical protein QQS21_006770 [Conoideocrella luteorostrata]